MTQQLSAAGAAFVRGGEGFSARFYLDPGGVGTIGIGFTWRSQAFRAWWRINKVGVTFGPGATMTREEADACLIYLFNREYGPAVAAFLGPVEQHIFDGTGDAIYNCGAGALGDSWAGLIKRGDLAAGCSRLRETRITVNGKPFTGLRHRRAEEAQLIQFGDYSIGNYATAFLPIDPMADGILQKGERGAPVLDLERRLKALGLYEGALDGIFGHGTLAAVLAFQRAHELTADGVVGAKTMAALKEAA